jgi:hypothetical protein
MEETNPALGEELKQAIRNQLRSRKPAITGQTLERLQKAGLDKAEAIRLMACVLAVEMLWVAKEQREFDLARYTAMMDKLPTLPE